MSEVTNKDVEAFEMAANDLVSQIRAGSVNAENVNHYLQFVFAKGVHFGRTLSKQQHKLNSKNVLQYEEKISQHIKENMQ